ncbi:MAG: pyruvate flavodoxin/ferredoxin oxidoreductase [Ignavibacteriales bacterium]|nr:pyruvate flavodoxin/ferredoxin oxidoreductase [Ignavibacteriales bacterium]
MALRLRTGNQMIAQGAIQAGCRFFAGYPITPATGIFKTMIDELPGEGGVALSAPDEISAVAYCIGASMRGVKAMTATSGPGWALMTESVQYAVMTETPLVIALVQRLGPSTGGATQGAQGDVLLAEFAVSGGYTLPILSPSTAQECFDLTILAFTWSELLRTPVVLLSDKEVGMTAERVDDDLLRNVTSQDRLQWRNRSGGLEFMKPKTYGTYSFDCVQEIPAFTPVGGEMKVTATGSAHNKQGKLQKNSPETLEVLKHLEEKIRWRENDLVKVDADIQNGAKILVMSYGITSRAAKDAVAESRKRGIRVSFLGIQSLFPVPSRTITESLQGVGRVVVAEENLPGLYRSVIERHCNGARVLGVNKIGSLITPNDILNAVQS